MSSIMRWRNGLGALSIMGDSSCLTRGYEPHDLETERTILLCRRLAHALAGEPTIRPYAAEVILCDVGGRALLSRSLSSALADWHLI
jgi:hypothetical protein